MRYDEYLRLGYGIGSGAVESAHKQVVHTRLRQAGMRWSEAGARRLLALRSLLLNDHWALLDRLAMVPMAATDSPVHAAACALAPHRRALAIHPAFSAASSLRSR